MKKQDRMPIIRRKREENKQLEEETRKMEQRLQMLKNALYKDVPQDTRTSSKSLWQSSCSAPLQENLNRNDGKIDLTKVKLRTLKKDSAEHVEKKVENEYAELLKKVLGDFKSGPSETKRTPEMRCGQCENKAAAVSCQECNEDYCAKCFAQFHLKGALRRHHSLPLSPSRNVARNASQTMSKLNHDEIDSVNSETESVKTNSQGCQCMERRTEKSSFTVQTETRDAGDCTIPLRSVQRESRSTSVEKTAGSPLPKIEFSSSLSYAERLLVHRNRRSPIAVTNQKENTTFCSSNDVVEEKEQIQTNMAWNPVLFEQLHNLATQNLTSSDLFDLCRLEDIEKSSECTSPAPSSTCTRESECASGMDPQDADSSHCSSVRGLNKTETNGLHIPDPPTEPPIPVNDVVLNHGEIDGSANRNLERNQIIWIQPESTSDRDQSNSDELTTIELIKRQLNQMTTITPKEPQR